MPRHLDSPTPAPDTGPGLSAGAGVAKKQKTSTANHCCTSATQVDMGLTGDAQPVIPAAGATFPHPSVPLITLASARESVNSLLIECVTRWAMKGAVAPPKYRRFG